MPFDSLLYAIHIVGYSLMSVSNGVQKVARWLLISSEAIDAVHSAETYWHWLIWVGRNEPECEAATTLR